MRHNTHPKATFKEEYHNHFYPNNELLTMRDTLNVPRISKISAGGDGDLCRSVSCVLMVLTFPLGDYYTRFVVDEVLNVFTFTINNFLHCYQQI